MLPFTCHTWCGQMGYFKGGKTIESRDKYAIYWVAMVWYKDEKWVYRSMNWERRRRRSGKKRKKKESCKATKLSTVGY